MNRLGREGYMEIARKAMETTLKIREGIESVEGLKIIGDPDMTLIAFTSGNEEIYDIGDALDRKGWYLDRLQFPPALHMTISNLNAGKEVEFLEDLREVMSEVAALSSSARSTRTSVRLVGGLSGILPSGVFDGLARMAGKLMGAPTKDTESASGGSQAALYGIHASLKNRKNVKKLVTNLLDGMFS
jgi:glutamate/tyrosine decarboxylase-like PLP-dependent enzyme